MNQKGFINIILIGVTIIVVLGITGYFLVRAKSPSSIPPTPTPIPISSTPTQPPTPIQQAFETVSKGGLASLNADRKNYVIKETSSAWENLWNVAHSSTSQKPTIPNINFNDEMIIAVFQGNRSSGGYVFEIAKIIEKDNSLEVFIKETSPPPNAIVTQSFISNYHIIKMKRIDKEVIFSYL